MIARAKDNEARGRGKAGPTSRSFATRAVARFAQDDNFSCFLIKKGEIGHGGGSVILSGAKDLLAVVSVSNGDRTGLQEPAPQWGIQSTLYGPPSASAHVRVHRHRGDYRDRAVRRRRTDSAHDAHA